MNKNTVLSFIKTIITKENFMFLLNAALFVPLVFPSIVGEAAKQEITYFSLIIQKYIFINYNTTTNLIIHMVFFQPVLIFIIAGIPFLAKKICQCEFGENYDGIMTWQKLLAQFFLFIMDATLISITYYKICYYNLYQNDIINAYILITFPSQIIAYIKKQYDKHQPQVD